MSQDSENTQDDLRGRRAVRDLEKLHTKTIKKIEETNALAQTFLRDPERSFKERRLMRGLAREMEDVFDKHLDALGDMLDSWAAEDAEAPPTDNTRE